MPKLVEFLTVLKEVLKDELKDTKKKMKLRDIMLVRIEMKK